MPVYPKTANVAASALFEPALARKYDRPGPRYSSYPTADRFIEAYDPRAHQTTLRQRNIAWGPAANLQPLSLYVHIPFCSTNCNYCICHKLVTSDYRRAARYLQSLNKEFSLVSDMLGGNRRAGQVRLGGGTPTFLSSEELRSLMRALGERFELLPGERAIEIDPRSVDDEKMAAIGQVGFNHLSVGVQDFNADVQRAINRVQSEEQTARAISVARKHGVSSVSIDLVYGLPLQTVISFDDTLDRVLALKPDRIALYSYRHAPGRFKSQRRHHNDVLPSAEVKLQIMSLAVYKLNAAGYDYIGKDHFALAHDELAVATRRPGPLVGLQAHSWQASGDLLAFGISAISRIGATYSQNVKTLGEYYDRLDRGEIPVLRGIELTADDLLRRTVIESLLCRFALSIESVEIAHLIKFRQYFADEWLRLEHLERDGLVTLEPDWISVTPSGRLMVRSIAMIFDRYLTRSEQREQFSGLL